MLKVQYKTDMALFFSSTIINIGNGKNNHFWEARWVQGTSPKEMAPNLFKQARFKRRSVSYEMQNLN
jgi:hypothetical protein